MFLSMACQLITKKCVLKDEAFFLLQVLMKRSKSAIIEDIESNTQLKPQREFAIFSDDAVFSANSFVMKCQDEKKIEKELKLDT